MEREFSKYARCNIYTQQLVLFYAVFKPIRKYNRKKISFILATKAVRYLCMHLTKDMQVVLVLIWFGEAFIFLFFGENFEVLLKKMKKYKKVE